MRKMLAKMKHRSTIKRTEILYKKPILTKQALGFTVILLLAALGPTATAWDYGYPVHACDILNGVDLGNDGGIYYMEESGDGVDLIINLTRSPDREEGDSPAQIRIVYPNDYEQQVPMGPFPLEGVDLDVNIPDGSPAGEYKIIAEGIITDKFHINTEAEPIPEFPTVAVPLIASVLLVWGFMRKRKRL